MYKNRQNLLIKDEKGYLETCSGRKYSIPSLLKFGFMLFFLKFGFILVYDIENINFNLNDFYR